MLRILRIFLYLRKQAEEKDRLMKIEYTIGRFMKNKYTLVIGIEISNFSYGYIYMKFVNFHLHALLKYLQDLCTYVYIY